MASFNTGATEPTRVEEKSVWFMGKHKGEIKEINVPIKYCEFKEPVGGGPDTLHIQTWFAKMIGIEENA